MSGKRLAKINSSLDKTKKYNPVEAFQILTSHAKPFESVDVVFKLGIDGKKSDQVVKGVVESLPSGLGLDIKVALFTSSIEQGLKAGADFAGFEELFEQIKAGKIEADVYLCTKDLMPDLAKLGAGKVLKSKMPNPKFGTVIEEANAAKAIKAQKAGKIIFRSNGSLVHAKIGNAKFNAQELVANYKELFTSILQARPNAVKPFNYMKKIFVSCTMGPSLELTTKDIANA